MIVESKGGCLLTNKINPKEDVVTGIPIDPPGRAAYNFSPP